MKITKQYLKQVIKEELQKVVKEQKTGEEKINNLKYEFDYNEMGGDDITYYVQLIGTYNNAFDPDPIEYDIKVNIDRNVKSLEDVIQQAGDQIATSDPAEILMKENGVDMFNEFFQNNPQIQQELSAEIARKKAA